MKKKPACSVSQGLGALHPSAALYDPAEVVGKTEAEANAYLESNGLEMRVVHEDGVSLVVTDNLRSNRVNVHTVNGVVTAIHGIG